MAKINEFGEIIREEQEEQMQEQIPTFTPPKAQSFKESLKVKVTPSREERKEKDEEKQVDHKEER